MQRPQGSYFILADARPLVRFAFCKRMATLEEAGRRLERDMST